VLRRKSGAGVSRNYFDVSGLYDVHALRALYVLRARQKQRGIPGKTSAKFRAHPGLSSHNLVIIINYLTMMFI
jgi:hypothetical protein